MDFPDLEQIKLGLELTTRGSTATNSVLSIVERLKALLKKDHVSPDERDELVRQLMEKILETREVNIQLKEQLLDLKEASLQKSARQKLLDRYSLWRSPVTNKIVYRLKKECLDLGEIAHDICPTCYQIGDISLLQGPKTSNKCMTCNEYYETEKVDFR